MEWRGMLIQMICNLGYMYMLAAAAAQSDCQRSCGNISIPYPFGTREGCYFDDSFLITCNSTSSNTPQAFLRESNIQILDISLLGQLRILLAIAYDCYNTQGGLYAHFDSWLELRKFPVSNTQNQFIAVGCDTYAVITGFEKDTYTTGCLSLCQDIDTVINGSCSGIGCCQTSIPRGVMGFNITVSSYHNHSSVVDFNPCSFAFVVEDGVYNFSSADLANLQNMRVLPTILDWSVGDQTCDEAKKDQTRYACKENSYCYDVDNGPGYLCNCSKGFQGNPYLTNGCQDIDECKALAPCTAVGICNNLPGGFSCSCPERYKGDGLKDGNGCSRIPHNFNNWFLVVNIALGISISLLLLVLGSSWLCCILRQRKKANLKDKFFQQNGGLKLQQQLSKHEVKATIFTADELQKATNNYHESRILGKGGQGTVYKGILPDKSIVAIKKSNIGDESQVEQFINEVFVLSQVNHRNVVKLLGCCLETQVPLLVYEYVTNGTLFDYIHKSSSHESCSVPWETRLKIATEAAGALSHLHSGVSTPIIHRDVKTTNILLDDNYAAKVSDFGASRFIPLDKAQLTTLVQGTIGYLDPEYFNTSQLTDKSDVYSFGVVLVELLTGKKAHSFERPESERNLATYFVCSEKEERFFQVLDSGLVIEQNIEQIKEVALLAKKCLEEKGEDRPTMKEVAIKLEGLMQKQCLKLDGETNLEETEFSRSCSTSSMGGYDSISKQAIPPFNVHGR